MPSINKLHNISVNRTPNKLRLLGSLRWRSGAGYL